MTQFNRLAYWNKKHVYVHQFFTSQELREEYYNGSFHLYKDCLLVELVKEKRLVVVPLHEVTYAQPVKSLL